MRRLELSNFSKPGTGSRRKPRSPITVFMLLCALLVLVRCERVRDSADAGQSASLSRGRSDGRAKSERKRVSVITGSVEVPEGYKSKLSLSNVDVFGGTIESASGLEVYFITGLNSPWVSPATRKNYEWIKSEQTKAGVLFYGRRREGGRERVDFTVADANFAVVVATPSDIERVLEIARSYEPGECSTCEIPLKSKTPNEIQAN